MKQELTSINDTTCVDFEYRIIWHMQDDGMNPESGVWTSEAVANDMAQRSIRELIGPSCTYHVQREPVNLADKWLAGCLLPAGYGGK